MKNTILFFDDYMLKEYTGVRKRVFKGKKFHEIETLSPKEAGGRMLYDKKTKKYRFWRKVLVLNEDKIASVKIYESSDMIEWEEISKDRQSGSDACLKGFISRDDFEKDENKRYKITYIDRNEDNSGNGYIGISPDGLNWNDTKEYNFCKHISDTGNNTFYNPIFDEYQTIIRGGFIDRRVFCVSSKDMKNWTKPRCLLTTKPNDEPCTEYYGLIVYPQEGYFMGILWKYLPPMYDTPNTKMAGKTDSFMVYSYDGYCWNFVSDEPVVERPLPPENGSTGIYLNTLDLSTDEEEWILSGELRRVDHACGFKPCYPDSELPKLAKEEGFAATGIYKIRREGLVALESISFDSSIVFKRIILHGDDLFFNISAPLGIVKFQIKDKNEIIDGFSFDDCIPFENEDEVRYRPKFKNNDISELKGRPIIIELKMDTALIFSVSGDFYVQPGYFPMKSLGDTSQPNI